jgi:hypothetical protein
VYDRVGVDRVYEMLFKGSWAAKFSMKEDQTPLVSSEIKDTLVFPE